MNPKIHISLPRGRAGQGVLLLTTDDRQIAVSCLGRSDNAAAQKHGNPQRDPLKPFGDVPTGTYIGRATVPGAGPGAERSFGPHRRVLLIGAGGDALAASTGQNPRWGLMIHGGAPSASLGLRPTHGCVRVSDESMQKIIDVVTDRAIDVTVVEV